MAYVALAGVSKQYEGGRERAVDDVTLEIEEGEFFVLLGPSGCGKSTLLRIIAGLEEPSEGIIRLADRVVNYSGPGARNIAMVFQNYALYPHMTVRENIRFPLKMRKVRKRDSDKAVTRAASMLKLNELLGCLVGELSGGERQRVALARAIVREPSVMLMDEPLSNLDALLRTGTREEVLKLHRSIGSTVVYVTHDQVEAMTMGDRVGIMDAGRLVQVGTPLDVYQQPVNQFVAKFIGSPPMNLLPGEIVERSGGLAFRSTGVEIPVPQAVVDRYANATTRECTLGIRPEALGVLSGDQAPSALREWKIELIENLGYELIIYLSCGDNAARARVGPESRFKEGDAVALEWPHSRLHFFGANGTTIRGGHESSTTPREIIDILK